MHFLMVVEEQVSVKLLLDKRNQKRKRRSLLSSYKRLMSVLEGCLTNSRGQFCPIVRFSQRKIKPRVNKNLEYNSQCLSPVPLVSSFIAAGQQTAWPSSPAQACRSYKAFLYTSLTASRSFSSSLGGDTLTSFLATVLETLESNSIANNSTPSMKSERLVSIAGDIQYY
ncbi:hypothetical protein Mapa_004023 [Marchantia paleacea]|nr:hypothetical protein Mapa_004023 [Marchantia paleacea]